MDKFRLVLDFDGTADVQISYQSGKYSSILFEEDGYHDAVVSYLKRAGASHVSREEYVRSLPKFSDQAISALNARAARKPT